MESTTKIDVLNCLTFGTPDEFWTDEEQIAAFKTRIQDEDEYDWLKVPWSCTNDKSPDIPECFRFYMSFLTLPNIATSSENPLGEASNITNIYLSKVELYYDYEIEMKAYAYCSGDASNPIVLECHMEKVIDWNKVYGHLDPVSIRPLIAEKLNWPVPVTEKDMVHARKATQFVTCEQPTTENLQVHSLVVSEDEKRLTATWQFREGCNTGLEDVQFKVGWGGMVPVVEVVEDADSCISTTSYITCSATMPESLNFEIDYSLQGYAVTVSTSPKERIYGKELYSTLGEGGVVDSSGTYPEGDTSDIYERWRSIIEFLPGAQ